MSSDAAKAKPKPISVQEEKEIHTAFERLCDFPLKVKLNQEKLDIDAWIEADKAKSHQYGYVEPVAFIKKSLARKEEIDKEIEALKTKPDMKVVAADVQEMFKFLNYKCNSKDIDEMIWEVDENLDGGVDWNEFKLMFNRNVMDQTGLEPNRMYNLAQFLIYDKNRNGLVSVDETMNLLYARYGRGVMEQKLKELFGEDMHEIGRQGGEITYNQYIASVERVQLNMFLETNKGRIVKKQMKNDNKNNKH
mmetsp:Transcript_18882/g.31594  ORF Transcript_18882/g.31594 Transcript_18882/m.31594 type:complete len:249 (+) Transcript_18882:62-808(+)